MQGDVKPRCIEVLNHRSEKSSRTMVCLKLEKVDRPCALVAVSSHSKDETKEDKKGMTSDMYSKMLL